MKGFCPRCGEEVELCPDLERIEYRCPECGYTILDGPMASEIMYDEVRFGFL